MLGLWQINVSAIVCVCVAKIRLRLRHMNTLYFVQWECNKCSAAPEDI